MYCPNCGTKNLREHHYCRSCGLKLDEISLNVAGQFPSLEYAALIRRKELLTKLGLVSLSIAGVIGLFMLLAGAFYYKLQFFSLEILMRSASVALVIFALASIVLLVYPKLVMKIDQLNPRLRADETDKNETVTTSKLLSDPPFEPASVTEHSTELLKTPK